MRIQNNSKTFCIISLLLLVAACSNQQVYQTIQHDQLRDCEKQPPSVYEECVKENSESYDDYERKRQEVLEQDKYS